MNWLLPISLLPLLAGLGALLRPAAGRASLAVMGWSLWAGLAAASGLALAACIGMVALDWLSLAITVLTLFVGAIVIGFSRRHMKADPRLHLYVFRIGLLIASVLVFVSARDLVSLGLAWLASGWLLAALIGHVPGWVEAGAARRRALIAFAWGDTALVVALVILGIFAGSLSLDTALAAVPALPAGVQTALAALLLVAAMARSSVPPFHKWLMGSMTAPTPVSALMHAGLVNAGGFLLIRFAPLLDAAPVVQAAAVAIGALGALFGTGVMIVRPDVKRALGGSTVAQMSFMIMTCGLGAYAAALWHLIAHGLFKAWLFLGAGSTIGRARPTQLAPLGVADTAVVTLAAAALAAVVIGRGLVPALPLPLLFALLTALASFAGLLRAPGRAGAQAMLALVSAGLVAAYLGGVHLVEALPGLPAGRALPSLWVQLAVMLPFIAAWAWQAARLPLPATLYIRMLNTGGPALIR